MNKSRNRIMPPLHLAAACALLAGGCATPTLDRIPLSAKTRSGLAKQARSVDELGVGLSVDPSGQAMLSDVRNVPLGVSGQIHLAAGTRNAARPAHLRISVNDQPLDALLDTASSSSLVDARGAQRLGLTPVNYMTMNEGGYLEDGLVGTVSDDRGMEVHLVSSIAHTMSLGEVKVYDVPFGIVDDDRGFRSLWWLQDRDADAILGSDLLRVFDHVTINISAGTLRVAAGKYRPNPNSLVAAAPLLDQYDAPAVEAVIEEKGPFHVLLSTAIDCGLWIPPAIAESMDLAQNQAKAAKRKKRGRAYVKAGTLGLNLSGFEMPAVPAAVTTLDLGQRQPPYCIMGNAVLKNYAVTLDFKAGKVYFETP